MLFSVDGTFIVQLVNFAIFFALVNMLFIKPVSRAIEERRRYIDSLTADYDKYSEEIVRLKAQAEAERSQARRDADAALSAARTQIGREVETLNADYASRVAHSVEQAHATVEQEMSKAKAEEPRLVRELSDEMLERAFATDGAR
jgi:F-type H+-transporting ATPase subunit b